jgi:hypothetical protein
MLALRRLLLLALIGSTFGCSGATASPGGGGLDLAGIIVDLSMSTDMSRSTTGIFCGPTTACAAQAQVCCTSDEGQTGTCVLGNVACMAGMQTFSCDGKEDCPVGTPECCFTQTGGQSVSLCQDKGYCDQHAGTILCHFDSDCASPNRCCPLPHSPYGACSSVCS